MITDYRSSPCILCGETSGDFDLFRDPESQRVVKICKLCQGVLDEKVDV